MSRHHLFDPEGLIPPIGFSHAAIPAEGDTLYIAGQTGAREDGTLDAGLVEQFGAACRAVARVIEDGGGEPADLVSMMIYTTDIAGYKASLSELGSAYRAVFGRHFPPIALIGVTELFDPEALVELVCVAVVPHH